MPVKVLNKDDTPEALTISIIKTGSHAVTHNTTGCVGACITDNRQSLVIVTAG